MEIMTIFLYSIVMMFMGFLLGICVSIETSEEEIAKAFEKGYFSGCKNSQKN